MTESEADPTAEVARLRAELEAARRCVDKAERERSAAREQQTASAGG